MSGLRPDPELAAVMAAMDAAEESDRNAVLAACRRIGYGRVMQIASEAWRERDPSGALSIGPCFGTLAAQASRPPTFSDWAAAVDRSRLGPLSYIHGGPKGCRIQWVREPRDINVYLRGDPSKGGVVMDGRGGGVHFSTPAALTEALNALADA